MQSRAAHPPALHSTLHMSVSPHHSENIALREPKPCSQLLCKAVQCHWRLWCMAECGTYCQGPAVPHLSWVVSASPFVLLLSADQSWRSRSLMNSAFQSSVAIPICQPQPWPASACLSLVTCELKALSTLCTLQSRELHLFIARAEAGSAHKQLPPPPSRFSLFWGVEEGQFMQSTETSIFQSS